MSELFGIHPVVLILAAVNRFDVEGMGQHESQAGVLAGIGQPIPAEHTFATHGETVLGGRGELQEES